MAAFFVYGMSEHCLTRNHCIAIRNEFDEMHACCMIQCFTFDQLLYSHFKYTLTGKIHLTDHDSTAIKLNIFIQYMPEYKTTLYV